MTRREGAREAPAKAAEWPPPAAREAPADRIATLQRLAGNRAVGRILARLVGNADLSSRAKAEATARAVVKSMYDDLLPHMAASGDLIIRNTAEFFTGNPPVLKLDAYTKRSDSAALMADPKTAATYDPTAFDAFFYGTEMDDVEYSYTDTGGTLKGSTMYVRGHWSDGTPKSLDDIAAAVVHEVSHYLVSQYGELPETQTDSSSFHRYADEFRAYWVQPTGPGHAEADPVKKSAAIREHLIGKGTDANSGYTDLHQRYFVKKDKAFIKSVDELLGPIGFNLNQSLRLHRLWQLLTAPKADRDVGTIVLMALALSPDERREARASSLIARLISNLGPGDAERVRKALRKLISPKYEKFLAAVVGGKPEEIKAAYTDLPSADKGAMAMNPGFLYNIGRLVPDPAARARIFAMTTTGRTSQYDATQKLIDALVAAKGSTGSDIPADVDAALKGMRDEARWTFFSWSDQAMLKTYVDVLDPKLAHRIRERLRD